MNKVFTFYGYKSPLSNFHIAPFTVDGIKYLHVEQYMMAQKAILFEDKITHDKIMKKFLPLECKKLGRQVKNFNPITWEKNKKEIVFTACYAKFSQNVEIGQVLKNIKEPIIAEASKDKIWGTGLPIQDKNNQNTNVWKGENLLGNILTEVRAKLNK